MKDGMVFPEGQLRELSLFTGAGGGLLGGAIAEIRPVCAVEIDAYARKVLLARQRDGLLPMFPIWDDVCTFDGQPWKGCVDIVTAGFPCQDISQSNTEARGLDGDKSGLWFEVERIVREVRPKYVFLENSQMLIHRGLGHILTFFAEMGMDAKWGIVGAYHVSAPHKRERIWVLAYPNKEFHGSKDR
jgi:DNA (cytosine-5)-methyltransferase 1